MADENVKIETKKEELVTEEICGMATSSNFTYGYEDTFIMEDIESRKLYINYPITPIINESVTYHILRYNEMDKGILPEERTPIRLYINTDGGSIDAGMSCISSILLSKTPVYTISFGYCYSMGLPLFLAGSKRFITPETVFMNHDGNISLCGDFSKVCDNIDFVKAQNERIDKFIMSRTKLTKKNLDKYRRNDKFYFAEEAYDIGIATDILGVTCQLDEIL